MTSYGHNGRWGVGAYIIRIGVRAMGKTNESCGTGATWSYHKPVLLGAHAARTVGRSTTNSVLFK